MSFNEAYDTMIKSLELLAKARPDVRDAFTKLVQSCKGEGVLEPKIRSLIALSIAIVVGCEYCIAFHLKALKESGVTLEEIMDAVAIAVLMGGGPAVAHTGVLAKFLDELGYLKK